MVRLRAVVLGSLALVAIGAVAASAQPTWLMRYKWTEGETATWLLDFQARGEVMVENLRGLPVPQRLPVTATITMPQYQTAERVDPDGNATVLTEMGTIEMDLNLPMLGAQRLTLDPKTGQATAAGADVPVPDFLKQFLAKPSRQVFSPRGEVLEMDLPRDLTELLNLGVNAPMQVLKTIQQQPVIFPEQEIALGHCWINRHDLAPHPGQRAEGSDLPPIDHTVIYKLEGFEVLAGTECARIQLLGVLGTEGVITAPLQLAEQQTISRVGPTHVSISGTIWFDHRLGRTLKIETHMLLSTRQETEGSTTAQGQQNDFHVRTELNNFEVLLSMVRVEEGAR